MSRFVPVAVEPTDLVGGFWNPGNRDPREVARKVNAAFASGFAFLAMSEMLDQADAKAAMIASGLHVASGALQSQQRLCVVTDPSRLAYLAPILIEAHARQPTRWKRGRTMAEAKWLVGGSYRDLVTSRSPDIVASHALHQQWNPLRARLVRTHVAVAEEWLAGRGTRLLLWDANMRSTHPRLDPLEAVAQTSHAVLGRLPTMGRRDIDMAHLSSTTTVYVNHWTVGMGPVKSGKPDHRLYGIALRGRMVTPPTPCDSTVTYHCDRILGHEMPHISADGVHTWT